MDSNLSVFLMPTWPYRGTHLHSNDFPKILVAGLAGRVINGVTAMSNARARRPSLSLGEKMGPCKVWMADDALGQVPGLRLFTPAPRDRGIRGVSGRAGDALRHLAFGENFHE